MGIIGDTHLNERFENMWASLALSLEHMVYREGGWTAQEGLTL
jgi:hypothetical protein